MFNPGIFHSYDIRGVVPDEFDPAEAYHIGRAYAAHTKALRIVVARDMRVSGDAILPELLRGLTDAGVNVVLIGQATTPMFYFAVHTLKADGGIMVTASHNPGKYNGMKMTRAQAVPIGGDSGLMDIRDLAGKQQWAEVAVKGTVMEDNTMRQAYIEMACEPGVAEGLKIVVDSGNGMSGILMPDVVKKISGEIIPLYWDPDGTFPNHEANPLEEKNMKDVQAAVIKNGADLGVAFDGDADRVFFCTEKGVTVPGDITGAIIAEEILKENPGVTILYDLRSSRTTKEVIEAAGGRASMCKVGHSNIKAQMRQENAVFAAELSGHFYFTPWYAESGLLAMMKVIKVLKASGKSMSEFVQPLLRYAKTEEINFEVADKEAAFQRLKEKFADAKILELDGVTFDYPDWWANVRPSNTEPLLRLNMEAKTPELLAEKQAEVEAAIKNS